jgi:hypothetical protein
MNAPAALRAANYDSILNRNIDVGFRVARGRLGIPAACLGTHPSGNR